MDKVFDRRLKEFEKNSISNTGNALALGNRPWHQVNTEIAVKEIEDSKRPKRVVDRLQDDDNGNHDTKAARVGLRISGIPNGRSEVTKKTGLLESLKPLHNGHLNPRRSTRNFGSNEQVLQSLSSTFDDIPVQEKYSKKQGLGDPWKKPLTYPKVGKKKTTVEWSDLERLDEGEFLNDNLISFYLRFLEQSLEEDRPDIARRVYFFNTFFFATLTNSHKGKKAFNYEGVQKWTRSVDLFTYDYIIVPINEHAHWYLAIICNLPALDRSIEIVERDSEPSSPRAAPVTEDENLGQSDQFLSMPANELDVGDSRTLTSERLKEPDESEARNSFAEMSLENDNQTIPAHRPDFTRSGNAEDEDKEMLDAQIEETLPGFIPSEDARHHPAVSANDQADAADELVKDGDQLDQGPKTTGRTKKSKRKSMLAPITKTDPSKPAIITFDSLGQSRGPTIKILKDYLREEARAKRGGMEIDATQIKGISAKLIPQQNNFSDCGLFLLGYVERFLENDPKDFVTKIIQQGVNGKIDWSKLVPSSLRASIRDQVRELNKAQTDERMESLKKASTRDDQRPELTPSRGRASVEVSEKGLDRHEGPATSKPTSPLSDLHTEIAEDFKTAAGHPNNNIDNDIIRIMQEHGQQIGDDSLEPLMQENERQIAQTSNRETNDVKKSDIRIDGGLGRLDGLSPIYVDSQSQQGMPISTTEASLPLAFDKEQSPRLPAEIPDSQGSDTARRFVQVLGREASKPWTADPHLRRDEDAATALPAETSSKQRQEHKQSSKHEQSGRGVPTGGQAWDMHEVQCINIDDD